MDTESSHPFGHSMTGSDYEDNEDLIEIETDYGDDEDLNEIETDYGDNEDDIEIETDYGDNEDDIEIETDYGDDENSIFLETTRRNPSLPFPHSADDPDPSNDTASMAEFDMMRSSPPADPIAVGPGFLTSAANWERGSTRDICANMPQVSRIRQAIYAQFGLKARPWQVGVLIDISQKQRDVCALASTNAGKSLVYQAILVITGGSVLVISPTIALMEDQVTTAL